ncbi:lipase family protein [Paenibacillus ehimensis]|uniref:Lipase family protein n=1 Tax=Paenibacillus ehimensis TaxID=79264 RepID=A0ABT8V3H7_9BACL|nr:lipase family protein [Paenibacillus ehimensis]MDO3675989.1 lipase family protein [Paenibacillus ehimensis]
MAIASNRAILLASIVYQALRQYNHNGSFELPPGYKLGAVLGKKKYPYLGFILESGQSIVIALRGTAALSELKKDLQFDQIPFPFVRNAGLTHRGLTKLYASALRERILSYLSQAPPQKRLYLAGHSIGGSLVTLCALDLVFHTPFKQPVVYTFGAPKVGNPEFVRLFNSRIRHSTHIANRYDLVPLLPISFGKTVYRHVRYRCVIRFRSKGLLGSHSIKSYYKELVRRSAGRSRPYYNRSPKGLLPVAAVSTAR